MCSGKSQTQKTYISEVLGFFGKTVFLNYLFWVHFFPQYSLRFDTKAKNNKKPISYFGLGIFSPIHKCMNDVQFLLSTYPKVIAYTAAVLYMHNMSYQSIYSVGTYVRFAT
jgi:hypothetical protein